MMYRLHFWQGPAGCQQMQWRNEPGGYLRGILTAKVYDVAVRLHTHKAMSMDFHMAKALGVVGSQRCYSMVLLPM